MKSTFSVIYYLKRQVVKKDGTVPVMGRITVDGSQTQFSCKLTVDPKLWDTKGGRVTGRSTAALETNRMLDKMRVRINRHYQEIMERDNFVTAEPVLRLHRVIVFGYAQPHRREYPHLLRRTRVDKHQPPENGRGVQHPPARHRQPHNRQIPGAVRGRQDIPRTAL